MKKNIKAFTLVEMLIVMGIIIILMTVGITTGRYAINRANDVVHQSAVDNIYTALQAYYTDNREYPFIPGFSEALDPNSVGSVEFSIAEYMDDGAFDGGTEATFYYSTDALAQEVVVCVSLFGKVTEDNRRMGDFYCNGNTFGISSPGLAIVLDDKIIPRADSNQATPNDGTFGVINHWDGNGWTVPSWLEDTY